MDSPARTQVNVNTHVADTIMFDSLNVKLPLYSSE